MLAPDPYARRRLACVTHAAARPWNRASRCARCSCGTYFCFLSNCSTPMHRTLLTKCGKRDRIQCIIILPPNQTTAEVRSWYCLD